jgi:hypothetical protein
MTDESSFYLGPTANRWSPKDWNDVVSAAAGGLLDESSWVELKADVPAANPSSNLETARDLASLALDGGLYSLGYATTRAKPVMSWAPLRSGNCPIAWSKWQPPA